MNEIYKSETEIEELVKAFDAKTLPKNEWTHFAHLTVAIWYIKNFDINDATCKLKSGIISYNLSIGGENNGNAGYHETLTIFWIDVVKLFFDKYSEMPLVELCNCFLNSKAADKAFPFEFYHKETLLTSSARARYGS